MSYLPPSYVYKITINETGQFYFGFRKANKDLPENDLLVNYFSSSKVIKELISVKGLNSIIGEVLFQSNDPTESYWHEQKLIEQHYGNPLLLNQHYQKSNLGFKMFLSTPESVNKMIETRKKRGCQQTPEYVEIQRLKHNKKYLVTSPEGETYEIFGLKAHCIKYDLNHSAMSQVGLGNKPHHKGWKCVRLSN